jgi:hypothetical protein
LGDFEESAQKPTVHFNIELTAQPTGFSDFRLNEAYSSSQSILAPFDFSNVFSHKPRPSTSATQADSTGRIVKTALLSPPLSIKNKAQVMLDFLDVVQRRSQLSLLTRRN